VRSDAMNLARFPTQRNKKIKIVHCRFQCSLMVIDAGKDVFQCVQDRRNPPVLAKIGQPEFDPPAVANCAVLPRRALLRS
jgi:hypothetical protein